MPNSAINSIAIASTWNRNKHKALIFKKRLGITLSHKHILERALLRAALENEAIIYKQDKYGTHYDIKFFVHTDIG